MPERTAPGVSTIGVELLKSDWLLYHWLRYGPPVQSRNWMRTSIDGSPPSA